MASHKKRGDRSAPAQPEPREKPVSAKPARPAARFSHAVALAVLAAIALIAYSNSFHDGNTLDNFQLLRLDKRIQDATPQNISDILHHTYWWPYGESGLYRPLATLSYLFNYAILGEGEHTAGYHVLNLLLHICNIALVYFLGLKLLGTRGRAFALAALWSVHPVLTESVTNMVGRPDLLAGIGVLGGFLCYLIATGAESTHRSLALAGAAVAVAIGVFSKESAVTVIGVIAVYEFAWWKDRRAAKGRAAALAAVAIPILAMLAVRMQVMSAAAPSTFPFLDNPLTKAGVLEARLTALAVLARYLWRLLCPLTLSADYSYNQIPLSTGAPGDWIAWLVVAALAVIVFKLYRWNRTAFFFAMFAAVTFVPMSNLLFPIGTIMAERFLYLPAMAFCACLILSWEATPPSIRAAAPIAAGVLVAAYALRTWLRNPDWGSDLRMAEALVKTSPDSYKVRKMLAFQSFRADPSHSNIDQVIANADAGLAILDRVPNSDNNAEAFRFAGEYHFVKADILRRSPAEAAASQQAYRRAAELFGRAISIMGLDSANSAPRQPNADGGNAYRALSMSYQRLGDLWNSVEAARRGVQVSPLDPQAYVQLGRVEIQLNQLDGAAEALLEGAAVTRDPNIAKELVNLFRSPLNSDGCAIRASGQEQALDPQCPSVKRLLCPALQNSTRLLLNAGRNDLAADLTRNAAQQYGCLGN